MPQNNAFYEYLTARDYLGLYATLKGFALSQIKKRVETIIFKLELRKKLESSLTFASELTLVQEKKKYVSVYYSKISTRYWRLLKR